jgi:hypothetical protein
MTFTMDPATVVQFLIAFVLPLLVGLVTRQTVSAGVKAVLLAGLNLALSLLTELGRALSAGQVYDLGAALFLALPAFVMSVGGHFGIWKPTGTSEKAQLALVTDHAPRRARPSGEQADQGEDHQ